MTSTRSVLLLFLLLVLPLIPCDHGFSQQDIPPGHQMLTEGLGSSLGRCRASRSSPDLPPAALREVVSRLRSTVGWSLTRWERTDPALGGHDDQRGLQAPSRY